MKRLFAHAATVLIFFITVPHVLAQQPTTESCFQYYDYGKLSVNLAPVKSVYSAGETMEIIGSIVNNNTFPITDLILYAHIKRVNTSDNFVNNGHYLIERKAIRRSLNFLPGESKPFDFELELPRTYPNGEYQIQYFLFSQQGFHLSGRPFLEEDTAGVSNFILQGGEDATVYFDLNSIYLRNVHHAIREQIKEVEQEAIPIEFAIIDTRNSKKTIPVTIKYYSFDDAIETNLVQQQKVLTDANGKIFTNFVPPAPGAYVILAQIDSPIQTQLKYRFAVKGTTAQELFMNDLGITNFPPTRGDKAFVCFHSPTNKKTPDTRIMLSILNEKKVLISQKVLNGQFGGEVQAMSLPFMNVKNLNDFWVRAEFSQNIDSPKNKIVEIHYHCGVFSKSQKDMSIEYASSKPDVLIIRSISVCGNESNEVEQISSIRILENGVIKKEAYNVRPVAGEFSIAGLASGSYVAEIQSGNIKKKIPFKINNGALTRFSQVNRTWYWWIAIITLLILSSTIMYLLKKRREHL